MLLFVIAAISVTWMHLAIRQMEKEATGDALKTLPELPEMQGLARRWPPLFPLRQRCAALS